jgi:hypothetical protein
MASAYKMKFFSVFLLLLFCLPVLLAQNDSIKQRKKDSLRLKLTNDSLHTYRFKKLRPYGNIDNRTSLLRKRPSNFNGYQLGFIVNEYHTFGVGFYRLNSATRLNSSVKAGYNLRSLNYNTVFYEYLLVNKKYFEIDLPFELGYGTYKARYSNNVGVDFSRNISSFFVPAGAGVKFVGKPVRWVGISLMAGYRYFIEKNSILDFNDLYFPIGIWVDFREIYRDIKYFGFQKKRYNRAIKSLS